MQVWTGPSFRISSPGPKHHTRWPFRTAWHCRRRHLRIFPKSAGSRGDKRLFDFFKHILKFFELNHHNSGFIKIQKFTWWWLFDYFLSNLIATRVNTSADFFLEWVFLILEFSESWSFRYCWYSCTKLSTLPIQKFSVCYWNIAPPPRKPRLQQLLTGMKQKCSTRGEISSVNISSAAAAGIEIKLDQRLRPVISAFGQ